MNVTGWDSTGVGPMTKKGSEWEMRRNPQTKRGGCFPGLLCHASVVHISTFLSHFQSRLAHWKAPTNWSSGRSPAPGDWLLCLTANPSSQSASPNPSGISWGSGAAPRTAVNDKHTHGSTSPKLSDDQGLGFSVCDTAEQLPIFGEQ